MTSKNELWLPHSTCVSSRPYISLAAAEPDAWQLVLSQGLDERTSVSHTELQRYIVTTAWQELYIGDYSKNSPFKNRILVGSRTVSVCNTKMADIHKDEKKRKKNHKGILSQYVLLYINTN